MIRKIQGKKLSKKTNYKQNFKKFIDSGYTNIDAFKKACKNDENLLIYTCLKPAELTKYIEEMKKFDDLDAQIKYLKNPEIQPPMNETEERYETCILSIADYLKNYIAYNGFVMNNGSGDAEDWTSEFWLKYTKICNFYRDRWFHRERLKKESTVKYNPVLYKEFVYICRMSITGEGRHQAFLATQKPDATLFRSSLDFKLDAKNDSDKSLLDVVKDPITDDELMHGNVNISEIKKKALELSKFYEGGKYYKQIKAFYEIEDAGGFNKKVVMLGKIFLYKAGLRAPKVLAFIKSLSNTYKLKFNISTALINKEVNEAKHKKVAKLPSYEDILEDGGKTRVGLILRKRGTTE